MNKSKTGRVCVTLPREMLDDFRLRSKEAGISVSRLVYLRLRTRKPVIIVTTDMLSGVEKLCSFMVMAKQEGRLSQEILDILQKNVERIEKLIDFSSPVEVFHVRSKERNHSQSVSGYPSCILEGDDQK